MIIWKDIFSTYINKWFIYIINGALLKLIHKYNEPIKKWKKDISMHVIHGIQMAIKHMEDTQLHPSPGKGRIQARTRYFSSITLDTIKRLFP